MCRLSPEEKVRWIHWWNGSGAGIIVVRDFQPYITIDLVGLQG